MAQQKTNPKLEQALTRAVANEGRAEVAVEVATDFARVGLEQASELFQAQVTRLG